MLATTDSPTARIYLAAAFADAGLGEVHTNIQVDYEHGSNFITCLSCGAQWSAHDIITPGRRPVDAELYGNTTGAVFEQVSNGDDYCTEGKVDPCDEIPS